MSYRFDYDPESGKTPWPLVWSVTPANPNWEGDIGGTITFSVHAIPDPAYPSEWDTHYSNMGGVGGGPVFVPSLPPEPVVEQYIYGPSSSMEEEYVVVDNNGIQIPAISAGTFFPYADIRYFKDGQEKSAHFPQEAIDDDFDYVVALVPDARASITKNIVASVESTSLTTLTGTFIFKINNDWSKARSTLEAMAAQSKDYFDELASQFGDQEDAKSNADNAEETSELTPTLPETTEETQTLRMTENMTYDEIFRIQNPEEINKITSSEPNLLEDIQKDTKRNDAIRTEDAELGTVSAPIDELLRNNDIDTLMSKYGYSYDEILQMLRDL